jgi:hypothetical protein
MGYQNNDRPEEIDELLLDAMFDLDDLRYENGMSAESIESIKFIHTTILQALKRYNEKDLNQKA